MRTLTEEELGTYSCSDSCKFNHSTSFLLTRYNNVQNIPILEAKKGENEREAEGRKGRDREHSN